MYKVAFLLAEIYCRFNPNYYKLYLKSWR